MVRNYQACKEKLQACESHLLSLLQKKGSPQALNFLQNLPLNCQNLDPLSLFLIYRNNLFLLKFTPKLMVITCMVIIQGFGNIALLGIIAVTSTTLPPSFIEIQIKTSK